MDTKLLRLVEDSKSVVALYEYVLTSEYVVPVVIVDSFTESLSKLFHQTKQHGRIILTQDDLTHGHDVYSVILNHIKASSSLLYGEDLLASLILVENELIPQLEGHIRHVLIDCREALSKGRWLGDMLPWLAIQCDRIWYACEFLLGESGYALEAIIDLIKQEWGIDHHDLYTTLHHGTGILDLHQIHDLLSLFVVHIDLLHKKATNKLREKL